MPSNNLPNDLNIEELFKTIEETKEKEITNFSETILHMEQRYAHFISSTLDVKKRICMELYKNKLLHIVELCNKSLTVMNEYYQTEINKLKKDKKQLIHKYRKTQKLLKESNINYDYSSQSKSKHKNKKKKKHKLKSHKSKSKKRNKRPMFNNNNNDGPNDIITDVVMNDNYGQLQFDIDSKSQSQSSNNGINFQAMPTFSIDSNNTPTITQINSIDINDNDNDNDTTDDNISHHKSKKKHKHRNKKHKKHKKRIKKENNKYKYKYRKLEDNKYICPPRHGDTDKTWLFCNHKKFDGIGVCGVKFIRTLKDREDQAQHYCDGDDVQKLITRKFGKYFNKCAYCDGMSNVCTRLATIDEINQFQSKLKSLQIVPNSYGGYKKIGAKQTISQLGLVTPRRKKKTRRTNFNTKKNSSVPVKRSFTPLNDEIINVFSGNDNDNITTESDINMDNKPLQRRSRKRKRREFEHGSDSNSEFSDSFVEQELKKQKLDKSELRKLELDELLSKALQFTDTLEWDVFDKWCRYCGARGSNQWLNCNEWGVGKLCTKHGDLYREEILDLSDMNEPLRREDVGFANENTEIEFLVTFIDTMQKIQFKAAPAITIDGKRRSLRNIKKERMHLNEGTDSDDESYSSDDDDDDNDNDNIIGYNGMEYVENVEIINDNDNQMEDNNNEILNGNGNGNVDMNMNGHEDEDDDIIFVNSNGNGNGNGNEDDDDVLGVD